MNKYLAVLTISFLATTTQLQAFDLSAASDGDIRQKLGKLNKKTGNEKRVDALNDY